jgi:hypothetical protein
MSIAIFGFLLNIVFAYCAYDIDAIMTSTLGQPLGALFLSALGNGALAKFLWLCTVLSNFGVLFVMSVSSSRVYFAYARDGAMPFSKWLSHVNHITKTPVNATVAFCVSISLLGLISVGQYDSAEWAVLRKCTGWVCGVSDTCIDEVRAQRQNPPWGLKLMVIDVSMKTILIMSPDHSHLVLGRGQFAGLRFS